jgi:hypothetical protein
LSTKERSASPLDDEALNGGLGVAPETTVTRAFETVTVGCKIPNGLILRLFRPAEVLEQTRDGLMKVKMAEPTGEQVVLNGSRYPGKPDEDERPYIIMHGVAFTPDVSKDFWDTWLEQNKATDMVKRGLVFARAHDSDLRSQAAEMREVKSGLEPIDPDKPGARIGERKLERGDREEKAA